MVQNGAAGTSDSYTSSRFPKSSIRTRRPPATRGEAAFTALAPDPTTSTSAWTLPSRGMLGRPSQRSAAAALRRPARGDQEVEHRRRGQDGEEDLEDHLSSLAISSSYRMSTAPSPVCPLALEYSV